MTINVGGRAGLDIVCNDRQQWLEARRQSIGASESAGIFGVGYSNQSPLTIWHEKRSPIPAVDAAREKRFRCGQVLQPAILQLFTEETHIRVEDPGEFTVRMHAEHPWMSATLDGVCDHPLHGLGVVEAKNVSGFLAADWKKDEPPLKHQIQVQHQLAVTGYSYGYLVGLVGGNEVAIRLLKRNDRFINDALIPKLEEFWNCVESGEQPEIDGSMATAQLLARLFPDDNGEAKQLPPESADWDAELAELRPRLKEIKARKDELDNKMKAAIGEAAIGVLPDGAQYTFKTSDRKGYTVESTTCRTLLRRK